MVTEWRRCAVPLELRRRGLERDGLSSLEHAPRYLDASLLVTMGHRVGRVRITGMVRRMGGGRSNLSDAATQRVEALRQLASALERLR